MQQEMKNIMHIFLQKTTVEYLLTTICNIKNDNEVTYMQLDSGNVNVKEHNEELQPNQKASPMYKLGKQLRVTFYRTDGIQSDGFVRYKGEKSERFQIIQLKLIVILM